MEWMERTTNSFLFLLLLLLVLLYVCVTTMAGYQLGSYLESYIESVSTLPAELKRNFTLIRELDARSKGWPSSLPPQLRLVGATRPGRRAMLGC
jgi:hypothetical protein